MRSYLMIVSYSLVKLLREYGEVISNEYPSFFKTPHYGLDEYLVFMLNYTLKEET